jgi:hypothetical protein
MINDLICFKCKHFRQLSGGCDAFPDGIPYEITETGESNHSEPLKGQKNELTFEAYKNESEQMK